MKLIQSLTLAVLVTATARLMLKLIKTGANVVRHARYVICQLAAQAMGSPKNIAVCIASKAVSAYRAP